MKLLRMESWVRMGTLRKSIFVFIGLLLPVVALAKGDGIGFRMEGTVTDVSATVGHIHFQLTGRFWVEQVRGRGTHRSDVEIDCKQASITVSQPEQFFADMPDLSAGAGLRGKGELLTILNKAAENGSFLRLMLTEAKMAFGSGGTKFTLLDGVVDHCTDPDWQTWLRSRRGESLK
jgi:hypothetical protein